MLDAEQVPTAVSYRFAVIPPLNSQGSLGPAQLPLRGMIGHADYISN
jgi:hypothetical protein